MSDGTPGDETPGDETPVGGSRRGLVLRFLLFSATIQSYGTLLGIDGGAGFQIIALEELGLSPAAIGAALGLGVVSIPVQLWAARIPLHLARRNLQLMLVFVAAGTGTLAVLVALVDPGSPVAFVALAVTVLAEIAISVLFATSWQPLLSTNLGSSDRQWVNARGRAAGGIVLVVVLLLFGRAGSAGRVAILLVVGAVALVMAWVLRAVPVDGARDRTVDGAATKDADPDGSGSQEPPADAVDPGTSDASHAPDGALGPTSPGDRRAPVRLLVLAAFAAASAWPLFPVYLAEVAWPGVNLGLVGAIEAAGNIGVALLWRPIEGDLRPRARLGAAGLVLGTGALVALPITSGDGAVDVAGLVAYALAIASRSILLTAILELLHRSLVAHNTVRVLTVLDVVASSSVQAGLFLGGLLVTASATVALGPTDPYQLFVLAIALGAGAATLGLTPRPSRSGQD